MIIGYRRKDENQRDKYFLTKQTQKKFSCSPVAPLLPAWLMAPQHFIKIKLIGYKPLSHSILHYIIVNKRQVKKKVIESD